MIENRSASMAPQEEIRQSGKLNVDLIGETWEEMRRSLSDLFAEGYVLSVAEKSMRYGVTVTVIVLDLTVSSPSESGNFFST